LNFSVASKSESVITDAAIVNQRSQYHVPLIVVVAKREERGLTQQSEIEEALIGT
jgi:hypothetical protein